MEEVLNEEVLMEKRKEKLKKFFSSKTRINYLTIILLLLLLFVAWNIRTINVPNLKDITTGGYTLGPDLDPFLFLRYAENIIEEGSMMSHDAMRNVPLGYNTATETKLLPYMIAYFYKFGKGLFRFESIEHAGVIFPAFMFILTALVFFFLVRKIFERKKYKDWIALLATAFLIVSPSLLSRTVAGIPEKESVGFLFMFLVFYLFLCAFRSKTIKKSLIFGGLAGISTGLMGLIWGAWIYVFLSIGIAVFLAFIFGKIRKKDFYAYFLWLLISISLPLLFFERYTLKSLAMSTSTGLCLGVFGLLLIDFLIFNTKIKNIGFVEKYRKKVPDRIFSLIVFVILAIILSSIVFGVTFIPNFVKSTVSQLTTPYTDRFSFTVAENRQPYFGDWLGSFGPILKNIPILFWLFFFGSILLFYEAIKYIGKKGKIILMFSYIIFLFALIFSKYSPSSRMNGENLISQVVYFGSFIVLLVSFSYIYYVYFKEDEIHQFKRINFNYLLLISFFLVSIIGARSAIRLIMVLAPAASILASYLAVESFTKAIRTKEETKRILVWILAILIIVSAIYALNYNYKLTKSSAANMIPSGYTHQWQKAMEWVRENTSKDAVFSHWWDYGYWVQSIGKRATILDGGNFIVYWDYLMGRHVLTGETEREALEFLYAHNATHLLIDSTEIGKYPAYSSIGSDENYDRYTQISTFTRDDKLSQETNYGMVHTYVGGVYLDDDFVWKGEGEQIFFPAYRAAIGGVYFKLGVDGPLQPEAIFMHQGRQINIPMRYVYYNNKLYDFETGYEACLYIFPSAAQQGQGLSINHDGVAMFLGIRAMKALWVRLYMFDEGEYFKLVHSEPSLIVESLKSQGVDVENFVYYSGINGPIKIWEIEYPEDIEFKPEYLETEYPDEALRIARKNF